MFISFEGTEGVGKSTLIQNLGQWLQQQGKSIIFTREPGGTPLAEKIRELLLTVHDEKMSSDTELLLMYAARTQHIAQVIAPALAENKVILCDRFIDASFAYQIAGRGLDENKLNLLNQHFVNCLPQLTFWLDAPIEMGMQRAKNRGELDRFEQEKLEFFSRVRQGYADLYEKYPERICRIDATQNEQQVREQAIEKIKMIL